MNLVKPKAEIVHISGENPLRLIESAGRLCYKSESKRHEDSSEDFVRRIIRSGHDSVLEHSSMTVRFVVDRGVSHELVRHRIMSPSQESTRYCNYKNLVEFVIPPWVNIKPGEYTKYKVDNNTPDNLWHDRMLAAEIGYKELIEMGWSPGKARCILPHSLKTELMITANFREWRHIFSLRCSLAAHTQMREVMLPLLAVCKKAIPVIFSDI
jgi:thymidylate synthase (FAD)